MAQPLSTAALLLALATACTVTPPPPPIVKVTSPQRGMTQSEVGRIEVKGIALPGPTGSPVAKVTVNQVPATLAADGSFTALVDVPAGAMLLETVATSEEGSSATDARAVQVGQLRPVGSNIERAITATLSASAFARLSAAAGPLLAKANLTSLLPAVTMGDDIANLKLTITKFALADAKISLAPIEGGITFSAELTGLSVAANAHYDGILVPEGSTTIGATADKVKIAGTLVVTPAGIAGFVTKLASPVVQTTNLRLQASGLTGQILDLLESELGSTINKWVTSSAESAMGPLVNDALGALAGAQQFSVGGHTVELQASPNALAFSTAGALVTMNIAAKIAGSEASPGFIFTPNGTPQMAVGAGIQVGLADDLVNEMLAEVHALKLLDIHLPMDFGVFDAADFKLSVPPMISAHNGDGSLRLVLGDMIATFTDHGKPVINAAVNAQVDLEILRGASAKQVAFKFGKVHLFVNLLDDSPIEGAEDLAGAATAGIGVQLESLSQFLVTVPVPSVAGVSLDNLALRADSGYVLVSGNVH
jgi:hypothetical protein